MNRPRLIVITDLDGTLLDQVSYRYDASLAAIRELRSLKIPLVLCSSKTSAEIVELWKELRLKDPFISENGGAVYFPADYFPFRFEGAKTRDKMKILELGTEISALRRALDEAAQECRVRVQSFGRMSADEVSVLTGLNEKQAALALKREYDEPFVLERGEGGELIAALERRGYSVTQGGRFYHVTGGNDKGKALSLLLELYRRVNPEVRSVGLGNSANDLPLLERVDRPILIKNPDGTYDRAILKKMPKVERSKKIGPYGWREMIEKILTEFR